MLRGLDISDMLIIDRLELTFQPGLNALTGETGAGKSILLDSLGFVLGWRGRADLVRQGAEQGEVTAWFDISHDHPAQAILQEAGLPQGDELILRRVNNRDGRKTAWVNDRRVSGDVLRQLSEVLVELHGQHDDRGLLNAKGHRAILDDFARLETEKANVRAAWQARSAARRSLEAAERALADAREEEDFLRHAVAELEALAPQAGEDAELDAKRRLMQGAERIRGDVENALAALRNDGAEAAAGQAMRWLEGVVDKAEGQLDAPLAALSRAMVELDEAADGISAALDTLSFDPMQLEATEERLFAIRALARKHGVLPDDLGTLTETLSARLSALDAGDAEIGALQAALKEAETAYDRAANALSAQRLDAGTRLDAAVMAELAPLKLDRAVFQTVIEQEADGPDGRDAVAFRVATNPGAPAGPLNKIASGGELSRFLLALKVCLTQGQAGLTMIFDEIDRGVGGATADAVGRRLAALADQGQVLVVTHSPQVAAQAGHHWMVSKAVADGITTSHVIQLDAAERVDEIARMLAGDTVTAEARAAALALLKASTNA